MGADYNREQVAQALRDVGLNEGDTVFTHSNIGYFDRPQEGSGPEDAFKAIFGAFRDILGDSGTLIVPTFSLSFCKCEPFDPGTTPSFCGVFPEMLRQIPDSIRSSDPLFSVAAIGPRARELTEDTPRDCFGRGSFWERLLESNGMICNLNRDAGATFVHYIEKLLGVEYRYDKLFTGTVVIEGQEAGTSAVYFCRDLNNPDTAPNFGGLDSLSTEKGLTRRAKVGRGSIVATRAKDLRTVIEEGVGADPWFLTAAAGGRPTRPLPADGTAAASAFDIKLPDRADGMELMKALCPLPRNLVSDGYDAALEAIAGQIPLTIHAYTTGTKCWSWLVPEKWTCEEAYIEDLSGQRIIDTASQPLAVASYSCSIDRTVSREELLAHLHTHRLGAERVPYVFYHHQTNWGFACSKRTAESLTDDQYRVTIRTKAERGTLRVGEYCLPGETECCFVLCAHLCHPYQANDGLSGVITAVEVMKELAAVSRRHTFRLLILPETIGSVAWLSHSEEIIPGIRAGLFLDMTGLRQPPALQMSYAGNTSADMCMRSVHMAAEDGAWWAPYREVVGNDERQFNAPGVRIPMLSYSRALPWTDEHRPFEQYHSADDTVDLIDAEAMRKSKETVLAMLTAWDRDYTPLNRFRGEPCLAHYGLAVDRNRNLALHRNMLKIADMIDGHHSVSRIAHALGLPFGDVLDFVEHLRSVGLVERPDLAPGGFGSKGAKTPTA